MADVIRRGSALPIDHTQVIESSPTSGYTVIREFAGTDSNAMLGLMYDYVRAGVATRFTFSGGVSRLEINDATQNVVLDVWQVLANEVSKDIFEHPNVSLLPQPLLALIRVYLDEHTSTSSDAIGNSPDYGSLSSDQKDTVENFLSLYLRGTTNYRVQQYVLRHTTNAPANWGGPNVADVGIDQIYQMGDLLKEITSASLWVNPAPARIVTKLKALTQPDDRDGYQWGWLKSASTETTAANNRVEIQTEYCLEQWSVDLYDVYAP